MAKSIRICLTIKPETNSEMKEQADKLGMNKSAYLAYLVNVVGKAVDSKGENNEK